MASANLDLVRSIYAAWEHGDAGMTEMTSATRRDEDDGAHLANVRDAAAKHAAKRTRLIRSARNGRLLSVNLFDYGECDVHLRGLPTRSKIKELHRYWFETGIPLVVDLAD